MSLIDLGILGEWDEDLMEDHIDALDIPGNLTLEQAGIEDDDRHPSIDCNGVPEIVDWWSDGEDSRYTV